MSREGEMEGLRWEAAIKKQREEEKKKQLTTDRISNIIRTWAKHHEHSVVVGEAETDELAEKLADGVYAIAKESYEKGRKGEPL